MSFKIKLFVKRFLCDYIPNVLITKIPIYRIRNFYYSKVMSIKILKGSSIHMNTFIEGTCFRKERLIIDENTSIGRFSYLDCRGGIEIGKNVSISPNVRIITAQHEINSVDFKYISKKVEIGDYVWIGTGAMIMPGIKLGKGSVVAAGSVVTKNVEPYTVVGGVPAKFIKKREKKLNYKCIYKPYFD